MAAFDEPRFHVCDLVWGEYSEGILESVQPVSVSRNEAKYAFACAVGVDYTDVRVSRSYIHIYSLQDMWDNHDEWENEWLDEHYPEAESKMLPSGNFQVVDADGTPIEIPRKPDKPPADWEPDEDEGAYQLCDITHPEALPVWLCEIKEPF